MVQKSSTIHNIENRFEYVTFNDETLHSSMMIKHSIIITAQHIDHLIEDCREKSLALTKLEECLMWCNKGLGAMQKEKNDGCEQ